MNEHNTAGTLSVLFNLFANNMTVMSCCLCVVKFTFSFSMKPNKALVVSIHKTAQHFIKSFLMHSGNNVTIPHGL